MGARAARAVAAAGVVVALLAAGCSSSPDSGDVVRISGRLPPVEGTTLQGRSFGPADYAGRILVVNFWNQDCPPCRREMPILQRDWQGLANQGVVAVGILYVGGNWPNDPNAARSFLETIGVTYPNVIDGSSSLARELNIAGIPSTIIADRHGTLRLRLLGRLRPGQLSQLVGELESGR